MEENAIWEIPAASGSVKRSLYFFEGDTLLLNERKIEINHFAELDANQKVTIQNKNKKARILILQGNPINEPVVQYGPFVMNTQIEIQKTFSDFQKNRFGGWPWPRTDMVHEKTRGRFAKFDDGEEIIKN